MAELLAILAPILVIDVMNPVLLGILVFAAGTSKPLANSASLLAGHTVAYFVAGVGVSFGVERISAFITDMMKNPSTIDFVLSAIIGVWALSWAIKALRQPPAEQKMPEWNLTPLKCFGFGMVVNFIGVPFALPYFAAVDQILKADLTMNGSLTALAIYNIGYALPFAVVPGSILVMGDRSKPFLERLNVWMVTAGTKAMPWLIGLLGAFMLFDAIYYFATGKLLY